MVSPITIINILHYCEVCTESGGKGILDAAPPIITPVNLSDTINLLHSEQHAVEHDDLDVIVYKADRILLGFGSKIFNDFDSEVSHDCDSETPAPPANNTPALAPTHHPKSNTTPPYPSSSTLRPDRVELKKVRNRNKKAGRRDRTRMAAAEDIPLPRAPTFITNAAPICTPSIHPPTMPHQSTGYTGALDRGKDYAFLKGTPAERLAILRNMGYQMIYSPDVSP